MSVTIISKAASSNSYATNEKPVDMYPEMMKNYQDSTPLTVILTRIEEARKANNVQIDWIEQETLPYKVFHTGADESTATTPITIADYAALGIGDMLFVPRTREYMRVSATVSDATVDVTRGVGDSTGTALRANEEIRIVGNAQEEGIAAINTSRIAVNSRLYNYQQIITNNIDTTHSQNEEVTHFAGKGGKRIENLFKLNDSFRLGTEQAIMFGYRSSTAGSALNIRTMGGLIQWLGTGTNVLDVSANGGVLTETMLDDWLAGIKNRWPNMISLGLCGSYQFLSKITQLAKRNATITLSPNSTLYGLNIERYKGAMNLDLIPAPLMDGDELSTWGFALDFSHLRLRYLRPVMLNKGVNNYNDDDFIRDRIRTEISMMVAVQSRHGLITGVKAAA